VLANFKDLTMTLRVLTASESLERLSHAATADAVWVLVDRPENLDEARKDVADLVACGDTEGFFVGSAHWAASKNYNMPRVGLPDGWDADGDFRHFDLVNAWRKANHGQFVLLPEITSPGAYRFFAELNAVNLTWGFIVADGAAPAALKLQGFAGSDSLSQKNVFIRWTKSPAANDL
jgi:hypothetical protein